MPASEPTFPLVLRRRLIGLAYGAMHSARRGMGSDVAGSRPYRTGDLEGAWLVHAATDIGRGLQQQRTQHVGNTTKHRVIRRQRVGILAREARAG